MFVVGRSYYVLAFHCSLLKKETIRSLHAVQTTISDQNGVYMTIIKAQ